MVHTQILPKDYVLEVGYYIALISEVTGEKKYYKIVNREYIPVTRYDWSEFKTGITPLGAGRSVDIEAEYLKKLFEVKENQLFVAATKIVDNYEAYLYWHYERPKTKNWTAKFSKYSDPYVFIILEDKVPDRITIVNPTNYDLPYLRFDIEGYIYTIEEVEEEPKIYKPFVVYFTI